MNAAVNIPVNFIDSIDLENLQFLSADSELNSIEEEAYTLFRQAVEDIKVIRREYIITVATSFGKDSTVTFLAALQAHVELIEAGELPQDAPLVLTSIDTGVENHLMQMLVWHEVARIKEFAEVNNYNIDIRIATPNLSRQWAPMLLSGLKLLSLARLNNDCSEELKIRSAERVENKLMADYNGKIVTLLGSRIEESTSRKLSLESRGQDKRTPEQLIEFADGNNRKDRVFAPIVNMSDEHVWLLLRRAGNNPITKPSEHLKPIPSYCNNHRLLNIVYGDATDGSCPVSSKRLMGDKKSAGGCGKSARTGCYTCLKPIEDKSATLQARSKRHGIISQNMLDLRNYMMSIGLDVDYRTWHTRAIDFTTGSIAAQPNVLNAETLDVLIQLFCQVTVDEEMRAMHFEALVNRGDEMLDEGYADIWQDTELSIADKELFASVYKEFATKPLIRPMSMDIAVYLSAIHARDGVKVPPFRAIHHWVILVEQFKERVEEIRWESDGSDYWNIKSAFEQAKNEYEAKGLRRPYPKVDPTSGHESEMPDAIMLLPDSHIDDFAYTPHTGFEDIDRAEGCMIDARLPTVKMPYKYAKRILPEEELAKLGAKKSSDLIEVGGFVESDNLISVFTDKPRKKTVAHKFSKRSIKKVSRAKGKFRVIKRGRTSLDSHHLENALAVLALRSHCVILCRYTLQLCIRIMSR